MCFGGWPNGNGTTMCTYKKRERMVIWTTNSRRILIAQEIAQVYRSSSRDEPAEPGEGRVEIVVVRTGAHTAIHLDWVEAWARVVHGCARPSNARVVYVICILVDCCGRPPCALARAGALLFY